MASAPAVKDRRRAGEGSNHKTHEVSNQAPPLTGLDLFTSNVPLVDAARREGAPWVLQRGAELGAIVGGEPMEWGRLANENRPVLKTHDRYGNRIDEVEFHPAWHSLMKLGVEHELHALPWRLSAGRSTIGRNGQGSLDGSRLSQADRPDAGPSTFEGAHVARAALYMTAMQAEAGFACPITMTFAVVPALRAQPELLAEWEPLITSTRYDPSSIPAAQKGCAIAGMAMTEKQGGSDVKANTTFAEPLDGGGAGGEYLLTGHKWFCSAPMSDLFLVLAQAQPSRDGEPGGLSCFLMPRILPDGTKNSIHIQRLKDKLGNHSNASSEIELHRAWARMVGEPGRGVPTIIEMVGHTRLDCVIGGAAGMRTGVVNATHHAAHRSAFGKLLIEQPLMQNVLADLCVESEAATALAMRLARAYDEADADAREDRTSTDAQLFKRIATAVGKYWTCKRAPNHAFESLECLGGNGYVEESGMPRLYREAPLASIWEGSGNVMSLDVLRALAREPRSREVFMQEVGQAAGGDSRLDAHIEATERELQSFEQIETRARRVVESMALALQGSLLVRHAPNEVADAFCGSRLDPRARGLEYGTLPAGTDFTAIIDRHRP
jgi:putative acyl-CoA dehydrogenase